MKYEFRFYFPKARKVSVVGDFNNWHGEKNPLYKDSRGVWRTEIELPPGEYYYRYLIDGCFELNDPLTNLYLPVGGERLASLILIDENGQRVKNGKRYLLQLSKFCLTGDISKNPRNRNVFSFLDRRIVAYFQFSKVEGFHTLTALWYGPDGRLYHWDEGVLWQEGEEPLNIWFWLDLQKKMQPGEWLLSLYLNGINILEESFRLKPLYFGAGFKEKNRRFDLAN